MTPGQQVRDVLHAADLIQLYPAAYEHKDAAAGEIFNIGGGVSNSLSLLELFAILEEILSLSQPLPYLKNPRRHSDQDVFIADISTARMLLGVTPRVSVPEGIVLMLDWVRSCIPYKPFAC
jgi:CDP-paratose 2-epimerase